MIKTRQYKYLVYYTNNFKSDISTYLHDQIFLHYAEHKSA
jgi:hypothetical protein